MRTIKLVLVLFFAAQCFGASSASTEPWQQIQQAQFTLIFQAAIAPEAERVADALNQYLANHLSEMPLDRPLRPIPLVLYSSAHSAGGNVGFRPYRSNWYNKPAPFSGLEWYDALAVHEGRHLVQFNQLYDIPLARAANFAAGEAGLALFSLAFMPSWFLEGDAVVAETTQTQAGRGRVAAFDLWLRTDALHHPAYSYDRAMLGTGFDRVPYLSPYVLGYFFTAYLRSEYGSDLFDRSLRHLGSWPGFNFNGAIRAETGQNLTEHYRMMMTGLTGQWQEQLSDMSLTPVTPLSRFQGEQWQSLYPLGLQDDVVIAAQVDAADGNFLVAVEAQQVTRLTSIPSDVARNFSSGSKTRAISSNAVRSCWIAEVPNSRKPLMETGELVCWRQGEGLHQLTRGEKLTSVAQAPDGFVAHRFTANRSSELVLLGPAGRQQLSFRLPTHSLAYDITPIANGWVFVLSGSDRDGIYSIDASLSQLVRLKATDHEVLRSPLVTDNWLVYQSDRTGIDQLMARSRSNGNEYQIASRPFGSYYPIWDPLKQRLVFADYTAQGQQLVSLPFIDALAPAPNWLPIAALPEQPLYAQALIRPPVVLSVRSEPFERSGYSVAQQLWNPHSWWVSLDNALLMGTVQSDDVLAKLSLSAAAGYHLDAQDWLARVNARYRTEPGPTLSLVLDKHLLTNLAPIRSAQIGLSQTLNLRHGAYRAQWLPALGLQVTQVQDAALTSALLGQLKFSLAQDQPPQAIATPLAIVQGFSSQWGLNDAQLDVLSHSGLTVRGLTSRQAVNVSLDVQALQSGTPLLLDSRLFGAADALGLTLRSGLDYRMNLGGVGQPLTSLAYWRNTELALNGRAQYSDDAWQTALGVTLQPSLNLLRNTNLILNPSLAYYHLLQDDSIQVQFSLTLAGF